MPDGSVGLADPGPEPDQPGRAVQGVHALAGFDVREVGDLGPVRPLRVAVAVGVRQQHPHVLVGAPGDAATERAMKVLGSRGVAGMSIADFFKNG